MIIPNTRVNPVTQDPRDPSVPLDKRDHLVYLENQETKEQWDSRVAKESLVVREPLVSQETPVLTELREPLDQPDQR